MTERRAYLLAGPTASGKSAIAAVLAREIGDTKKADELAARAKKYYTPALEKAKEDKKSLDVLKAEMKSYGL